MPCSVWFFPVNLYVNNSLRCNLIFLPSMHSLASCVARQLSCPEPRTQGGKWSCHLRGTEAWEIRVSSPALWRPSKHQDLLHSPALPPCSPEVAHRLLSRPQVQSPHAHRDQRCHLVNPQRQTRILLGSGHTEGTLPGLQPDLKDIADPRISSE